MNVIAHARDDDIKLKLDHAMETLEQAYPELRGVLPKIYAGSNLDRDNVAELINLFSRKAFDAEAGRESDVLGRVYEYFITNFASTEGNRGGEFFTPRAVVRLLVEMLEPEHGVVFDPACGSGGMFVQSARFTERSRTLSFYGQERIDTTLRLCKMNLLMHGLNGDIRLGNSLLGDQHADLKADYVIANPLFNIRGWGADKISGNDPRLTVGSRKVLPTDSNANYFWMLHFLSKNRRGTGGYRARTGEILFIDAREKGEMVSRRQRVLTDEEIHEIAALYHHFCNAGDNPEDVPGFCKVTPVDEVKRHGYKLTPGIYVGTQVDDEDDVPYEEKMPALVEALRGQFQEAERLQAKILANLLP